MTRRGLLFSLLCLLPFMAVRASAQDDPGKSSMGKVKVSVLYATNGDPAVAGEKFQSVDKEIQKQLQKSERLNFKNYRVLGEDLQPIFRSYENWAQPLKPSDEVLLRFEARSRPTGDSMRLDLELWISRKKILKTDAIMEGSQPLYVLGPEWRGGRLIISVALASEGKAEQ